MWDLQWSYNWNENNVNTLTRNNWRESLVNTSGSQMSATRKTHNKSGRTTLSILEYGDHEIDNFAEVLYSTGLRVEEGLIQGSPCKLMKATDGRFSYQGKKVTYGYHIAAFKKFGRERLLEVEPNKVNQDSLTISHLCGTRDCCEPSHLLLESKLINDERTHCHFAMRHMLNRERAGNGKEPYYGAGYYITCGCPHTPACGTLS